MPETPQPTVCVVGAGAVGRALTAFMHRAGCNIHLVTHTPEQAAAINKDVILLSVEGSDSFTSVPTASPDHRAVGSADIVLVCVKCYDTASTCDAIAPHISSQQVILLHNGIGASAEARLGLPKADLWEGVASFGVYPVDNTRVIQYGPASITVSPCPGSTRTDTPAVAIPGLEIIERADTDSVVWSKLCLNCGINPVTALHSITNGKLPTHPDAWATAIAAAREAESVAQAAGIALLFEDVESALRDICATTSGNRSSMALDVMHHRPTEIDYINGYIVECGAKAGIETPVNSKLAAKIKRL